MNERGWFTLLIRGGGLVAVLASVRGVGALFGLIGVWVYRSLVPGNPGSRTIFSVEYLIQVGVGSFFLLLAGLYMLIFGERLINWLCKGVVGTCVGCGYRLDGGEIECPECGVRTRSSS